MKTIYSLLIALSIFTGTLFAQTSGGPDTYGYTWKTNADPNGQAYKFVDIKGKGTQITGLGDDNSVGTFNLNWDFHYYWNDYNKALVGSNGWISFTPLGNIASPFPTIPSATAPNNYIAAMLSDLTFTNASNAQVPGTTAWYWTNNLDSFIVQYDSVPFWTGTGQKFTGRNTFQIILSGVDSSVTFQYRYQNGLTNGTDLKSGIENQTGVIGLQVLNNTYPTANTSVKFYYPNPVTYQVFDATPAWNQNSDNGGFFISAKGSPKDLKTDIENVGNQTVSNINVTGEVLDAASVQVWDTTSKVFSLLAGADSMLTYPKKFNTNTAGTYTYRSTITLTGDMNSGNNATDVELVAVDTTQPVIGLSFSTPTATAGGALNWTGGGINDGGGVYIIPPFYPASVVSLDYFIANGSTGGFTAEIRDDNGTNNAPGTVLSSDTMQSANLGAYNNVPLSKPVVLTSGGIYISWLMYPDTTVGLGVDITAPLSLRNYEIVGGSWATYRDNSAGDLMIQANITKYNFGTITTATTADACPSNGSGTASVSVTAGTSPPYTYSWSAGGQTTTSISGLAAGNYTVTITDSLGIVNTTIVPVYSNIAVTTATTTTVSCFGGNNGSSTATIGGSAPFSYLWSNGQTTQTATGLAVGIYTVTATNGAGCKNMAIDTISGPAILANTFSVTTATCVGGNGTANAIMTGGTAPYTYLWSNLQTTSLATGLSAGSYTLAVTDANSCTFSAVATVVLVPFVSSTASTPTKCAGSTDGVATSVVTSGGTSPYTYAWSSGHTTQVATGLAAGNYTVVTTDAVGCSSTKTVTVTSPATVVASSTSLPATYPNFNNGSATGSATGGTAPYNYVWSNGASTQTITGLSSGNYTVCVTDANNCSACDTVNVLVNGINEIYTGASVVISPNPFNSSAQVKIDFVNPTHNNLTFILFDIYGREVQSLDLEGTNGSSIDFTLNRGNNIPNGMYFFRLNDDKGILSTGKLLVQ